jgi:adenosylcobinamide-phosphate synthase
MPFESTLLIVLIALIADWFFGEPEILWKNMPHPVVLFGKSISAFDKAWNKSEKSDAKRYRLGSLAIAILIAGAIGVGLGLQVLFARLGPVGFALETFIVFVLLAQKSLIDHVAAVGEGLSRGGLEEGRKAIALIVGREPSCLDGPAMIRASIESLSENFSDGVVAPALWYAVFGLPGILAYKMINTADSMIGHRNETYRYFGRTAAQIDDLANWLPARFSALLIAAGALFLCGSQAARDSLAVAMSDAGLHRSPNSGWPEAAMAGGGGFALGGPRVYPGETVNQAFINGAGRRDLEIGDMALAIRIFSAACFALMALAGICLIVF